MVHISIMKPRTMFILNKVDFYQKTGNNLFIHLLNPSADYSEYMNRSLVIIFLSKISYKLFFTNGWIDTSCIVLIS